MTSLIPDMYAEIFSGVTDDGSPNEKVLVVDRRDRNIGTENFVRIPKEYRYSFGAMNSSWLDSDSRCSSPARVFASHWLAADPRPSFIAMKAALRELGKIESCTWAREMFAELEYDPDFGIQGEQG